MWYWRRLLRVLWTARRSNQSNLNEINPEYSLEGLMLMFQYFCHVMQRTNSLEKTLMLGKIEGRRRRRQQRMRWLDSITDSVDMSLSKLQEMVKEREAQCAVVHRVTNSWTQLKWLSTHVHWVSDVIQLSHPLSTPSPPALSLSQHQGLFQGVSSLHQVAEVLERKYLEKMEKETQYSRT